MAEYGKLLSRIWSDSEFIVLTARAQQVYCLLLSHPSRNLAGILPLTLKRWAASTADGTVENVSHALGSLAANKFIVIDWDLEEVLIRTYIRNDEVYRQPNLMTAARRFALQATSPALRWALHDELTRLPGHKDAEKTLTAANGLVEGLIRPGYKPFAEPLGEPLPEPMGEPPGVGGYLTGVRVAPAPTPSPAPTPAAVPIAQPVDASLEPIAATSGADLVQRLIPREHPDAVKTALRIRASELINTGTPAEMVGEALQLWLTKPHLGPNVLPSLVSEVIKLRTPTPNGIGKPSQKALGWGAAGAELLAEMEQS